MGISAIFTLYPLVVILESRIFANRTRDCAQQRKAGAKPQVLKNSNLYTYLSFLTRKHIIY